MAARKVILDPSSIDAHLPRVVLAFFCMGGLACADKSRAYDRFLKEFRKSQRDFPMVRINVRNREVPFEDVYR